MNYKSKLAPQHIEQLKAKDQIRARLDEDSSDNEESLSENKELIDTMTLKTNLNSKVLIAAKSAYFNNKIKEFNFLKNKESHSALDVKLPRKSLTPQKKAGFSPSRFAVPQYGMDKILGPKRFYADVPCQTPLIRKPLDFTSNGSHAVLSEDENDIRSGHQNEVIKENSEDEGIIKEEDLYETLEMTQEIKVNRCISDNFLNKVKMAHQNSERNAIRSDPFKSRPEEEVSNSAVNSRKEYNTDNAPVAKLVATRVPTISDMVCL